MIWLNAHIGNRPSVYPTLGVDYTKQPNESSPVLLPAGTSIYSCQFHIESDQM